MSDCCQTGKAANGQYDMAVIGAGSAGFSAAITAAEQGAHVAIIGSGMIGGTCVNVGCVPSKTLIRAAEILHNARFASRFDGIEAGARVTDWQAVVAQKQALVDALRKAKYSDLLPQYNSLAYIEAKASFSSNGALLADGKPVHADRIIIATGSRAAMPAIKGLDQVPVLTSTQALELSALPASLIIIGAGFIGAELAQMFARAGVKVTLVSRRGLLAHAEPEISNALSEYFAREGISIVRGITYEHIEQTSNMVRLHLDQGGKARVIEAEKVIVAAGRTPNTDQLNLPAAGIDLLDNQGIRVDAHMRTTRDGVYAAGDVTGRDQFVYMAAYGARIAAMNALEGDRLAYDNRVMPAVVFTDPQVASVGLSEQLAREKGFDVKTSILTLDNVPRALAARDTRGLIKLIADAKTKKLLGAHILAPEGADSIQTAAVAIKAGMTHEQLAGMIFPYLTTVEGLKLAAQTFDMDVSKLSCCAG